MKTNGKPETKGNLSTPDLETQFLDALDQNRKLKFSLEESDMRFHQLVEGLPVAFYTCDKEGRINLFNRAAEVLWGRTPEVGKELWCGSWKIFNPDGSPLPLDECPMAVALREGRPVLDREIVVERIDGTRKNVLPHPRPIFDPTGKLIGAMNVLVDITHLKNTTALLRYTEELKRKSEDLKKSEERYHRMVSEVQDYVIIFIDRDGKIQNWNKGAEKIKGYSAEEAIGKNFRMFYLPEDREAKLPERLIQIALEEGKSNHEGWRVRKDGTKFWGSVAITAIHNDEGDVIGFSKVTRDLTERKAAEEIALENARKLEEKNSELEQMNQELASFAYVSSHDLQEPLRKIQTFASRIVEMEEANLSEKGKDYFLRMQNAALRMQTLIEDLLAYSRTNTSEKRFEATDLNVILNDIKSEIKEVIDEKKVLIESHHLPTLYVIPFQIRQLFINILINSIKFSKAGIPPRIQIKVNQVSGKTIADTHANPEKQYAHFSIADNGIGFDPEHRLKIFEVFQRLHGRAEYSGTGIGLAICKKIVENHKGVIHAESQLDQGATFHIYLPIEKLG